MMSITDYNLTPKTKKAIKDSKLFASSNSHGLIRTAHLFYGCLSNLSDRIEPLFKSAGVSYSPEEYIKDFKALCENNEDYFLRSKNQNSWHSELNDIISEAKSFADENEDFFISVEHILYCILTSDFSAIMDSAYCDFLHMSEVLLGLIIDTNPVGPVSSTFNEESSSFGRYPIEKDSVFLSEYCLNLNIEAEQGQQSPITSRDKEIDELIEILCKRNKSNAVLLGESGVGKTALVEGLAQRIIRGEVPSHIEMCSVYSVDIASMVAGTQYRGQFEERFKGLLREVEDRPDVILFIDEIHTIMGAGNSNDNGIDASSMLKPALARGAIKCIGATTFKEYEKSFGKDPALKRRFDKVEVKEPTKEQTLEMINNSIGFYKDFHGVNYSKKNIQDILDLSEIYLSNKRFPEKAFDIIDQVGAKAKIQQDYPSEELSSIWGEMSKNSEDLNDEDTQDLIKKYVKDLVSYIDSEDKKRKVSREQILKVFEEKTGIPKNIIGESCRSFSNFNKKMKKEIFGQDEALERIYNILCSVKAGLNDPDRPLANFLFVGPTSVGKTFTAKNIAKHFFGNKNSFLQINMSEYQDKTGISKLLGSNAGYVGYEDGGILTEFVSNNPNSVILFDEIEKCDPKILDLLLHLLDEGYISDGFNRRIDFSKCIIVMTTNIGHREATKNSMGFISDDNKQESYKDSLAKYLRPELVARIQNTLIFNTLNDEIMASVIDVEINKIKKRLLDRGVDLKIPNSIKAFLIEEIKSKKLNARNIKELVVRLIQFPIASFMMNSKESEKISLKIVDKSIKVH